MLDRQKRRTCLLPKRIAAQIQAEVKGVIEAGYIHKNEDGVLQ
jgi:hypothetical protein